MLRVLRFLQISLVIAIVPHANMYCYFLKILSVKTAETPKYHLTMKLYKNDTLSSLSHVVEQVETPMWNLQLVEQKPRTKSAKVLYNATLKACDFWSYMKHLRAFNSVADYLFKKEGRSNMSLKCPLKVGVYLTRDIMIPPDTSILRLMYVPQTIYTLYGRIYSQLPNKEMVLKCSYEINGTVLKKC